jgi:uncharacterized protein YkwD
LTGGAKFAGTARSNARGKRWRIVRRSEKRGHLFMLVTRLRASACLLALTLSGCPERSEPKGRDRSEEIASSPAARGLANRTEAEKELLLLVNQERQSKELSPLTLHPLLAMAAQDHAEDMLARGYFAHESRDGKGPMERAEAAGYGGGGAEGSLATLGENLAEGQLSPQEVVRAWMGSPPHRRNLLDPDFREMGLGLALGPERRPGARRILWVLDLGSRRGGR